MTLLGTKVRFLWPDDGTTGDAVGEIIHVAWGEDGNPGLFVRWQAGAQPRETFVRDPAWLVTDDGVPLDVPPRIETIQAGGFL